MSLLRGLCIAFSMYSKIPMPQFEWKEKDMRYSICFFPLIGLVIGAITYAVLVLESMLEVDLYLVRVLGLAVIPVIVTGGIHVDGFMDVSDALSSYQNREKKLEILKDPHIGAFAVIKVMVLTAFYLIGLSMCLACGEKMFRTFIVLGLGMVLSRSLSGISVVSFKCAKDDGTLYTFAQGSDKKKCMAILIKEAGITMILMVITGRIMGALAVLSALLTFLYYYIRSNKEFGGITGDVAGWFVSICEVTMTVVVGLIAYLNMEFIGGNLF